MTRRIITIITLAAALLSFASAAFAADMPRHQRRIILAADLLKKMANESDAEAFADTVDACKAIAIFPAITTAGLGIGGSTGEGIVLKRTGKNTWAGPSYVRLTAASVGLQIGVESTGLILCVTNEDGLQFFTGSNGFKLGGDVSIAAGPVGRTASAGTDSRAAASIYSYSISEGAFAGLTFSGSSVNINVDANKAYWGKALTAKEALSQKASGEKIKPLIDALNALAKKSK